MCLSILQVDRNSLRSFNNWDHAPDTDPSPEDEATADFLVIEGL